MIELKIRGKEFELAGDWDEVMLDQFIDVANVGMEKYYSPTLKSLNVIAALSTNKEQCIKYLTKLSHREANELGEFFDWSNKDIEELTGKKSKLKSKIIEIEGVKYHLPGDNDILLVEDTVSIETILADKGVDLHPLEIAFGMLLREVDEDDNRKEFTEEAFVNIVTKLPKHVKAMDVLKHLVFFSNGEKSSTKKGSKAFSVRRK